ncbi:MAG TPA: hypothetical protein VFV99_22100, partial [Kofleriaceae bacterium]|nr:hypothetical protein [Kofleriaceae bacterium]
MDCTSGFRYGELSGPMSGTCVGVQQQDGGVDIDTPPGQVCYGTGLVMACFAEAPTNPQTFTQNTTINTDTSLLCATTLNQTGACVIAAQSITINGGIYVAAVGTKPLVFVADQTITVTGRIDVASYRQFMSVGAAGDVPGCNAGTAPTGTSGGAGGSFGGLGGAGAAVGTAGMPGAVLTPTVLRGGCPGQTGADNVAPMGPGTGGHGGGAVFLIANTSISVAGTGVIDASGEGGAGATSSTSGGGGGGGSGGYIGFDTPSLMVSGAVFANGGGGGEASGASTTGVNGADPTLPTTAALGGAGGSNFGTDGGNGSVGATLN